jgi:hypothetical protein
MDALLSYHDLGRCSHLGSLDAVWKVVEVLQDTALCNMIGTEDCIIFPQEMVAPLIEEYEEVSSTLTSGSWVVR